MLIEEMLALLREIFIFDEEKYSSLMKRNMTKGQINMPSADITELHLLSRQIIVHKSMPKAFTYIWT